MAEKHQPERMCIGCYTRRPKQEMMRIVCNRQKEISLDFTGKANGRGAYLCRDAQCLQKAKRNGKLSKSLAVPVTEELYERLERECNECT